MLRLRINLFFTLCAFLTTSLVKVEAARYHGKLGRRLNRLNSAYKSRGKKHARRMAKKWRMKVGQRGRINVLITLHNGMDPYHLNLDAFAKRGAVVDAISTSYVRVNVDIRDLESIANHVDVKTVRLPTPHKEIAGMGSNLSESINLTGAGTIQQGGNSGSGAKVAVVDLGFIGLANAIAAGELPVNTTVVNLPGTGDDNIESGTAHGVGVSEHVMDMAPGVELYVIKVGDELDLENAADYIRDNGIQIANHSVGWVISSYYDDTGGINDIINRSHDVDGVFWAVASGNDANSHWRGTWSDPDGDDMLNFTATDEMMNLTTASSSASIFLNWNQYGNSVTDLDLYIYDKRNNLVARSEGWQNGAQDPAESVYFNYNSAKAPYRIVIQVYAGPTDNLDMTIFSFNNDLEYAVAASSLMDPANAHGAFAVGAIYYGDWQNSNPPLESYSSQGPTNDGRLKPEIVAPDGTTSLTYGPSGSYGTSFASPTTAGAAALLLAQTPTLTADDLADAIKNSATDIGILGPDSQSGYGKLNLVIACSGGEILSNGQDDDCDGLIDEKEYSWNSSTTAANIQSEIAAATVGDILQFTLTEDLTLNATLLLNVANMSFVQVANGFKFKGMGITNGIKVLANNVTIDGINIQGTSDGTAYGSADITGDVIYQTATLSGTIVKNVTVTGSKDEGVQLKACTNCLIDNVSTSGTFGDGISYGTASFNSSITNSTITTSISRFGYINIYQSSNITVDNVEITQCGNAAARSTEAGPGIRLYANIGPITIINSNIHNNVFADIQRSRKAAIAPEDHASSSGAITVSNSVIQNNIGWAFSTTSNTNFNPSINVSSSTITANSDGIMEVRGKYAQQCSFATSTITGNSTTSLDGCTDAGGNIISL